MSLPTLGPHSFTAGYRVKNLERDRRKAIDKMMSHKDSLKYYRNLVVLRTLNKNTQYKTRTERDVVYAKKQYHAKKGQTSKSKANKLKAKSGPKGGKPRARKPCKGCKKTGAKHIRPRKR